MRAGEFKDDDNTCAEGAEEGLGYRRLEGFHCFKMGNHADVKEKLRRWQHGRERVSVA